MRKLLYSLGAIGAIGAAAALSAGRAPATAPSAATVPLSIRVEDRNPWTSLAINNQPRTFQFAIVTDRTGGHRPGVFPEAIRKLNLLQPEFVISVGDLIEGYSEDSAQWAQEWAEFQGKLQKLQMPFFYVPGNHDLSNPLMSANWQRKFGRTYYDFRYNDVLFMALNSDDPPREKPPKTDPCRFSPAQVQWFTETLARNADVRWTFLFLHKPAWNFPEADPEQTGWAAIERALGNRPHTVFAGHLHNYAHFERNGRDYIMLATTGGSSKLRGRSEGEFDQVTWVTVCDPEPVIANLLLDGIEDKLVRHLPNPKPSPPAQ